MYGHHLPVGLRVQRHQYLREPALRPILLWRLVAVDQKDQQVNRGILYLQTTARQQ